MNLMKLVSLMMSVLMKQVILERCYCPQLNLKDKVRIIYLVNDPAWLLWNRVKTSGKAL